MTIEPTPEALQAEIRRLRDAIVSARWRLAKGRALWNGPCHECDAALERGLTGEDIRERASNLERSVLDACTEPTPEALEAVAKVREHIKYLLSIGHKPDHIQQHFGYPNNPRFEFNEDNLFALALDAFARQARNRALEEAALIAMGYKGDADYAAPENIAEDISALKSKEPQT